MKMIKVFRLKFFRSSYGAEYLIEGSEYRKIYIIRNYAF